MKFDRRSLVQRDLHFAIVDEVDKEPVEGYITITPAADGSPLAWEELSARMQVIATGTAGTLLAEQVQVVPTVDENG